LCYDVKAHIETEMPINLKKLLNETIVVELRSGEVITGKVNTTYGVYYIEGFHRNGMTVEYNENGTSFYLDNPINENLYDIIKIKEIKEPSQPTMSYEISKQIRIHHQEDDFDYNFTADEYGTVCISSTDGTTTMTSNGNHLYIPKDCIQNFIDALEQFK